jgi:hypothetical protein
VSGLASLTCGMVVPLVGLGETRLARGAVAIRDTVQVASHGRQHVPHATCGVVRIEKKSGVLLVGALVYLVDSAQGCQEGRWAGGYV